MSERPNSDDECKNISIFIALDAFFSNLIHVMKYRIWCFLLEPFIGASTQKNSNHLNVHSLWMRQDPNEGDPHSSIVTIEAEPSPSPSQIAKLSYNDLKHDTTETNGEDGEIRKDGESCEIRADREVIVDNNETNNNNESSDGKRREDCINCKNCKNCMDCEIRNDVNRKDESKQNDEVRQNTGYNKNTEYNENGANVQSVEASNNEAYQNISKDNHNRELMMDFLEQSFGGDLAHALSDIMEKSMALSKEEKQLSSHAHQMDELTDNSSQNTFDKLYDPTISMEENDPSTWFSYSTYLEYFLFNNDIFSALNQIGLIITTRMEVNKLIERHEDIFIQALERCFCKGMKGRKMYYDKESKLQRLLRRIENEMKFKWNWIANDLRSWLYTLRLDSSKGFFQDVENTSQSSESSSEELKSSDQSTHCTSSQKLSSGVPTKESHSSPNNNLSTPTTHTTIESIISCVDLSHREAAFLNECLGIEQYIDIIVSSKSLPYPKPHPQVYQFAMEELNIDPNNIIVLEGSAAGVISAKMADIPCIIGILPESPAQREKHRILVADFEKNLKDETMLMLQEGAVTVLRNFEYLKFSYLKQFLSSVQK